MSNKVQSRSLPLWRRFLTPGWFITAVLVVAFSYFAFTFLAPWQLGKDDAIVERNEQIQAAYNADPVPYSQVAGPDGHYPEDKEWTRVIATGTYLADHEVLLRMRPVDKNPAFQSLVPFELESGQIILVHRGWVPSGDGVTVPEITAPPSGTVSLVGMLRADEPLAERQPMQEQGYQQVYSITTDKISELTGLDISENYVMLSPDQEGVLNPMPVPTLDRGSHLSYGLQWLAFGVMAPLGLAYFIWAEIRERRREKGEHAEMAAAGPPHPENAMAEEEDEDAWLETDPDVQTVVRSRSVRDRYGDSKPDYYAKIAERQKERF